MQAAGTKTAAATSTSAHNMRETIESIVIAFVLAFLFRTFEAEAFVIPTGSMAPTLQGRHKDVDCPKCGFRYRTSSSKEEVKDIQRWRAELARAGSGWEAERLQEKIQSQDVVAITCPMCRYSMSVDIRPDRRDLDDSEIRDGMRHRSYNGDRIIVSKFAYELHEPDRFDVVVFKFPGDAKMNYIKRLVGKPGETVRIHQGDLYVMPDGEDDFSIARKPPGKVLAMMQIVHDHRYRPADLDVAGWPLRWQAWPRGTDEEGGWQVSRNDGVAGGAPVYSIDGTDPAPRWIRYRHIVPTWDDWRRMSRGPLSAREIARVGPQLITDFYAYNTDVTRDDTENLGPWTPTHKLGLHWVGDLALECDIEVRSGTGKMLLDLVGAGRHFECRIDVETGRAVLGIDSLVGFAPTAKTPVVGPGSYRLRLANVDDQLLLWVDDVLMKFDAPTVYEANDVFADPDLLEPRSSQGDAGDLAPVGVGSHGASLEVTGLRVFRDIYYIAVQYGMRSEPLMDYDLPGAISLHGEDFVDFLSDPRKWHVFARRRAVDFELVKYPNDPQKDQFFVLGDNSPFSQDGRLWDGNHYVERRLLIGKAMLIYWPHSWNKLPGTNIPLPFFPNFSDMGMVR